MSYEKKATATFTARLHEKWSVEIMLSFYTNKGQVQGNVWLYDIVYIVNISDAQTAECIYMSWEKGMSRGTAPLTGMTELCVIPRHDAF